MRTHPRMRTTRVVSVVALLYSLGLVARLFLSGVSTEDACRLFSSGVLSRAFISLVIPYRVNFAVNFWCSVLFMVLQANVGRVPHGLGSSEIYVSVLVICIGCVHEASLRHHAIATLALEETSATNLSILNAVCDDIINLDSDFLLTGEAPKLASILMRTQSPNLMMGTCFLDLLTDVDKKAFKSFVAVGNGHVSQRQLQLGLQDACGQVVFFEVYQSTAECRYPCYCIGLREIDDWHKRSTFDVREPTRLPSTSIVHQASGLDGGTVPASGGAAQNTGEVSRTTSTEELSVSLNVQWKTCQFYSQTKGHMVDLVATDDATALNCLTQRNAFHRFMEDIVNYAMVGVAPKVVSLQKVGFKIVLHGCCSLPQQLKLNSSGAFQTLKDGPPKKLHIEKIVQTTEAESSGLAQQKQLEKFDVSFQPPDSFMAL